MAWAPHGELGCPGERPRPTASAPADRGRARPGLPLVLSSGYAGCSARCAAGRICSFDLTWRPFLLNPDMPRAGMSRAGIRGPEVRRRGTRPAPLRLHRRDRPRRGHAVPLRPHPPHAHPAWTRTVWCAGQPASAAADEMVEALFAAHFTDGLDIGDVPCWRAVAAACGLDAGRRAALPAQRRRNRRRSRRQPARPPARHQRRALLRRRRPPRHRRRAGTRGDRTPARRGRWSKLSRPAA